MEPVLINTEVAPLDAADFAAVPVMHKLSAVTSVAVAVSGGPDSMALLALVDEWAAARHMRVYALTVDHALRAESAAEAAQVGAWIAQYFPRVTHEIMRRDELQITPTKLQEQARADRYRMMNDACARLGVSHLLLAHHRDDQAETFLMRLCKGSGLDGLAGMADIAQRHQVQLVRPLLGFKKAQLVATCTMRGLPFVNDPSNHNEKFSRVRLREAREVLAREGLSVRRLAATAQRIARARTALEFYTQQAWETARVVDEGEEGIIFSYAVLQACPADIRVRVLLRALDAVSGQDSAYGPRLEQVEILAESLFPDSPEMTADQGFMRTTLHQCVVERSIARGRLHIRPEMGCGKQRT